MVRTLVEPLAHSATAHPAPCLAPSHPAMVRSTLAPCPWSHPAPPRHHMHPAHGVRTLPLSSRAQRAVSEARPTTCHGTHKEKAPSRVHHAPAPCMRPLTRHDAGPSSPTHLTSSCHVTSNTQRSVTCHHVNNALARNRYRSMRIASPTTSCQHKAPLAPRR